MLGTARNILHTQGGDEAYMNLIYQIRSGSCMTAAAPAQHAKNTTYGGNLLTDKAHKISRVYKLPLSLVRITGR